MVNQHLLNKEMHETITENEYQQHIITSLDETIELVKKKGNKI